MSDQEGDAQLSSNRPEPHLPRLAVPAGMQSHSLKLLAAILVEDSSFAPD